MKEGRTEVVMGPYLFVAVLVVLAFLCFAGPGGDKGSRRRY
jgi:hypothetical protein